MSSRRVVGRMSVALVLVLVTAAQAVSAQTPALRASEGEWVGSVGFRGASGQTEQVFSGGFGFVSTGGEVEGSFQWSGGVNQMGGVISGSDSTPRFDLTTVVSRGVPIPDVTGGGEIQLTVATCERLEGTGANIDVELVGSANIGEIEWWAVRGGAATDPAAFFEAFEALRVKVSGLLASLERGSVILGGGLVGQLEPLLTEAEMLAATLGRADGCGAEFYRSVIAAEVERLIEYLLANPDVDVFTLGQLLLTAQRAGLIGGSADGAGDELDVAARALVAARIAAAVEAEDVVELELLSLIAEDVGWDDLAYDAIVALVRIGA